MRPEFIAAAVFLFYFAAEDLRHRTVPLLPAALFALTGLVLQLFVTKDAFPNVLSALVPGCLLAFGSLATRGGIGMGDAIILCILGLFMPLSKLVCAFLSAMALSAFYAAVLLTVMKKNRNTAFPFLPFLFLGYLLFSYL